MARSDRELIDACAGGDAAAWDEFVERFGRLVYSIPRKLGFSEIDGDDIFQIVMGIALRGLSKLRDETRITAWLIRTTYRECWRLRRNRKQTSELADDAASGEDPTEELVSALERQQLVRQGLGQLETRCKTLVEALFFGDNSLSYEELASSLGMPIGSLGPTRARCLKKLETILRDLGL